MAITIFPRFLSTLKSWTSEKIIISAINQSSRFISDIFTSFNIYKSFLIHRLILKEHEDFAKYKNVQNFKQNLLNFITDEEMYKEIRVHFKQDYNHTNPLRKKTTKLSLEKKSTKFVEQLSRRLSKSIISAVTKLKNSKVDLTSNENRRNWIRRKGIMKIKRSLQVSKVYLYDLWCL